MLPSPAPPPPPAALLPSEELQIFLPASLGLPGQTAESQPLAPAAPTVLTTVSGGFILTSPAIGGAVTHPVFRNAAALLAVEGLWATCLGTWGGGKRSGGGGFLVKCTLVCVTLSISGKQLSQLWGLPASFFFLCAAFTLLHSKAKSLLGNGCGDPLSACLSHH